MSNLPGLSLGSRFWDKASAVTLIQTDRSFPVALRSSRQYLIAGLVFFGRLALWGSNPLCEWVLAKFVFRVPTFHRWGSGGKKQQSIWRVFVTFSWFQKGRSGRATAPAWLQVLFEAVELWDWLFLWRVSRGSTKANKYCKENKVRPSVWLLWTYVLSQLSGPFYILKMWLYATRKCCRWFHADCDNCEELCLFIFWSFTECVSKFWWRIPGGGWGMVIHFHIPKDNSQSFPGLVLAQVSIINYSLIIIS